ncbi:hypothetical protein KFK09_021361 [Dendrobium nobile]|uniref:Uncharacterized protein n=1 Tax=Dendrobium nobile TaxID=94219 RepID=A0A8T3APS4_DENNO|nr:hypothetical protein KFK09_021361 [Dendrobium nobile]
MSTPLSFMSRPVLTLTSYFARRSPRSRDIAAALHEVFRNGYTASMTEELGTKNTDEVLKPFFERASEAEERIMRLEALLGNKKGESNTESKQMSAVIKDLQLKLEIAQAELATEQEKASKEIKKLVEQNLKLHYRISHLLRAVKEADSKLNGQ